MPNERIDQQPQDNAPLPSDIILTEHDPGGGSQQERKVRLDKLPASDALTAHLTDGTAAHAASAVANTPAGTISSTDVQAAVNEIDGDIQALPEIVAGDGIAVAAPVGVTPNITQTVSALGPDVQVFDTPGTTNWTMPSDAKLVEVICIGGGGGGGSGRLDAAGTSRFGGGGGGGGAVSVAKFLPSDLSSPVSLTVGIAGVGGAANAGPTADGTAATGAGSSSFGTLLIASAGGAGGGGGNAAGTGGKPLVSPGQKSSWQQGPGGDSSVTATPANPLPSGHTGGGGGGGGIDTGNTSRAGGSGTGSVHQTSGNSAGGAVAGNGTAGSNGVTTTGGSGGGGGGAGGGAGANGGVPGGGGGGSGGCLNGTTSPKGGDGGHGRVIVITYR